MPSFRSDGTPIRKNTKKRNYIEFAPLTADGGLVDGPPAASKQIPAKSSLHATGKVAKYPGYSKTYQACRAILALRTQGYKSAEIAQELGLKRDTILTYLNRGIARGWLKIHDFDQPQDQTDHVLAHKAVRNLDAALDEKTKDGDMTARATDIAMEVAKGVGLLKQHQVVRNDGDMSMGVALQVNVVMPPEHASAMSSLRVGSIGGAPAIDADIMEE